MVTYLMHLRMFVNKVVYFLNVVCCVHVSCNLQTLYTNFLVTDVLFTAGLIITIMRKKKLILDDSRAKNGRPSCNSEGEATSVKLGAARATVEKTSIRSWFFCLVCVSLLSLTTRLYNLHQPASVWLVWLVDRVLRIVFHVYIKYNYCTVP